MVAWITSPRVRRDVLRLATPRFDVTLVWSAAEALAAVQRLCGGGSVLMAEYAPVSAGASGEDPAAAHPGPVALLEAARIRCPGVRRLLLAPSHAMHGLIALLHGGTTEAFVPVPIEPAAFITALCRHGETGARSA